jgi:hypothetical protein
VAGPSSFFLLPHRRPIPFSPSQKSVLPFFLMHATLDKRVGIGVRSGSETSGQAEIASPFTSVRLPPALVAAARCRWLPWAQLTLMLKMLIEFNRKRLYSRRSFSSLTSCAAFNFNPRSFSTSANGAAGG